MKVLYISSEAQATGASFSMVRLVEEERVLGIDVVPVVHKGNTDKLLNEKGIDHYIVNAWSWCVGNKTPFIKVLIRRLVKGFLNIPCYYQYKRIIKKENPDIVHINALTTYVGAKAAISCKKPLVWHIREMIEEDLNSHFWSIKSAHSLMKKAYCFIAISKCVEDKYSSVVGAEKIQCIYNGVDTQRFLKENHTVFNNDNVIITMAGRITKEKGQYLCLKELIPILKTYSNVILQFAGSGNDIEMHRLHELIKNENVPNNQIGFLGFVNDIETIWEKTDIAVVYSKFEAFGRVTVEAQMAGCVVVGYNSGGTSELINDGVDGYLFDADKSLSSVVTRILNDKDSARNIANKGKKIAGQVFTSKNNAVNVIELYRRILDSHD